MTDEELSATLRQLANSLKKIQFTLEATITNLERSGADLDFYLRLSVDKLSLYQTFRENIITLVKEGLRDGTLPPSEAVKFLEFTQKAPYLRLNEEETNYLKTYDCEQFVISQINLTTKSLPAIKEQYEVSVQNLRDLLPEISKLASELERLKSLPPPGSSEAQLLLRKCVLGLKTVGGGIMITVESLSTHWDTVVLGVYVLLDCLGAVTNLGK